MRLFSLFSTHSVTSVARRGVAGHLLATYKISFISAALFPHDITYCFAYQFSTHFCQTFRTTPAQAPRNRTQYKCNISTSALLWSFFFGDCYSPTDKYLSLLYVLIEAVRFFRFLCNSKTTMGAAQFWKREDNALRLGCCCIDPEFA